MGFVKSMVSNKKGAGWEAQQDPNAIQNLQQQYGVIQGVQGQLNNIAQGQGPNPALDQLQQTTDQNIQQNAGMIASQKGLNPALAARLAGQNAGQANQQAAGQAAVMTANQQLGALGQLGSLAGNAYAGVQGGINSANSANAGIAQQNASGQFGLVNGVGGALGVLKAHGGMIEGVHKYAVGGPVAPMAPALGPQSALGQFFSGQTVDPNMYVSAPRAPIAIPNDKGGGGGKSGSSFNEAGDPSSLIGGDAIGGLGGADLSAAGGAAPVMVANHGAFVPGKAKVKGDNYKNDTVPAVLSPGEIVIPRSITQGKDAPKRAAEFVAKVLAKNGLKKK